MLIFGNTLRRQTLAVTLCIVTWALKMFSRHEFPVIFMLLKANKQREDSGNRLKIPSERVQWPSKEHKEWGERNHNGLGEEESSGLKTATEVAYLSSVHTYTNFFVPYFRTLQAMS